MSKETFDELCPRANVKQSQQSQQNKQKRLSAHSFHELPEMKVNDSIVMTGLRLTLSFHSQ